jgi:phosphoadenosine phosphosulfate reductase
MALSQLNFAGLNMVEVAIARLKEFCPPEGYYFADSYGKDSSVCDRLLDMSGVKHDAHYSQGGIDPPELVYFGRKNHPETLIRKPEMSIWKAITKKGMPTRTVRWCCEMIKEQGGAGRTIVTGIRWQESARRKNRRLYEVCHRDKTRMFLNPIIDWTAKEVWEFIRVENIPYCSLYDEGFKRLGCVLCPMGTASQSIVETKRWPKIAEAWHRSAIAYWENHLVKTDYQGRWTTAEDFWHWWLARKNEPKKTAQCFMLDN